MMHPSRLDMFTPIHATVCALPLQVGHYFGLSHTWAQATGGNQTQGCEQSAQVTSLDAVFVGNSDAVRDTPPQAATADGSPIRFGCNAGTPTPLRSCTTAVGFPQGDNYYANFVNYMVSGVLVLTAFCALQ